MRPIIFADNQEITRLGLQTICEPMANTTPHLYAENRQQLIQQLSVHPMAVVVLDYTLFDFTSIDSFLALQLRFEIVYVNNERIKVSGFRFQVLNRIIII
ncbi:hypothetical protein AGMMS4956_04280 [Bacteroidia bacterium]|nr:hypothetical protein AGMMS4956_04280 [Bacteroidia bacterium]